MKDADFNIRHHTGSPGVVLLPVFSLLGKDPSSWQKYILAYLLLTRNCNQTRESKDLKSNEFFTDSTARTVFKIEKVDINWPTDTSESLELKKKKLACSTESSCDSNCERSADFLIPGLHDDIGHYCLARTSRSDYPSLACLNRRFNSLIQSNYLYRLRRKLGVVEHWVYLACSLMPWEAFTPVNMRWMRLPRMPCDDCFSLADKESLAVGTRLLVFGKEFTGLTIWMYSLVSRDWSRCRAMNLPRCLFGSSSAGEIAIIAGGCDKDGKVLKSAEMFDSEQGFWRPLPDMEVPRRLSSGFFMDGKFHVIGGVSSTGNPLTCAEEFDIGLNSWRRIENMYPSMNSTVQSPPLIAVVNNQLYAADKMSNVVKKYDRASNTWNTVKPLPVRADSSNGWGIAFKACGDRLLVVGPQRGSRGEVIVLHAWRPGGGHVDEDWEVLSVKERAGGFVYNCAIMGC